MKIFNKPIGEYVLLVVVGLGAVLLIIDSSVLTGLSPADRTLTVTVTGNIDPSMSLTLGSSYVARQGGIGCKAWSLFGGWQLKHSGERRIAEVADGKFSVTLPVEDRSDGRCGYTFQGVSMGIARKGESPNRVVPLFAYSTAMSDTEMTVANPLDAYCSPIIGSPDEWYCSRQPDGQAILGYRTDRMPAKMVINVHIQPIPIHAPEL